MRVVSYKRAPAKKDEQSLTHEGRGPQGRSPHAQSQAIPIPPHTPAHTRTLVASCFRGALPPVDLRAVCLVRAMVAWWVVGGWLCREGGERKGRKGQRGVSAGRQ